MYVGTIVEKRGVSIAVPRGIRSVGGDGMERGRAITGKSGDRAAVCGASGQKGRSASGSTGVSLAASRTART
jgi:hypothetical protein